MIVLGLRCLQVALAQGVACVVLGARTRDYTILDTCMRSYAFPSPMGMRCSWCLPVGYIVLGAVLGQGTAPCARLWGFFDLGARSWGYIVLGVWLWVCTLRSSMGLRRF